jgi:hypothetical protein
MTPGLRISDQPGPIVHSPVHHVCSTGPARIYTTSHQSKLRKVKGLCAKKVEAGKLYYLVEWDSVGGQEWPTDWVSEEHFSGGAITRDVMSMRRVVRGHSGTDTAVLRVAFARIAPLVPHVGREWPYSP